MKAKAIGIIRVSQIKNGAQSPEVQRRLIQPFADRQDWDLTDVLNENEIKGGNVSGGADLSKRPGFGPALELVKQGKAGIIVAADLSRLFRDIDIQRQAIEQIEAAGGEFWTVANGRVSHETADSELMANVQGSFNHYQRRYARDKSWLAVELAIEQGKVPWSQTAPGYVRDDDSRLHADPVVRPIIERAFALRATGGTIDVVRGHLSQHGIRRSYHGTTHLLRDRVYVGEIHFGKHTPNLSAHEPIIDRDIFDAVQHLVIPRGRKAKSNRLLARLGVLVCANCGSRMVVGTVRNGAYYMYRCPPTGSCTRRVTISAEIVEGLVVDEVKRVLTGIQGTASSGSGVQEAKDSFERAQAALDGTIRAFEGLGAEPAAIERLKELREARDDAREHLVEVQSAESATEIAVSVGDWEDLTLEERRALVRAVIERVTVNSDRGNGRVAVTPR